MKEEPGGVPAAAPEGDDILVVKNTKKRGKSQEIESLSDEEKALLETYLGGDSQVISASLQQKAAATEKHDAGNGGKGEKDGFEGVREEKTPVPAQESREEIPPATPMPREAVDEVPVPVQDSRMETPLPGQDSRMDTPLPGQDSRVEAPAVPVKETKEDGGHTDLEISPLDERDKNLDLDQIRSALGSVQPQGRLVLNMEGLSDFTDWELGALNVVWRKTTAKQVQMAFKNLPPRLREKVSEYIPRAVFLP